MDDLLNRIVPITELRRNFGGITAELARIDSLILTKGGEPFAILKSAPALKKKLWMKSAGSWKGTPLGREVFWKDVLKKKSRTVPIEL